MASRHRKHKKHAALSSHIGKNITIVTLGFVIAYVLSKNDLFHEFLLHLGSLGYIGAFIGGMLFVSTFTVATGALILLVLAEGFSPIEIGVVAGMGAVLGDITIFHIIKDTLQQDITYIYNHFGGRHLSHVLHTKYFHWTLPVIGALIIASPLPDELGVGLMGISKMSTLRFLIVSFILNAMGIFLIVSASTIIKP